jgi:kanamycin kinase/aminoglycoside 3'-phosphotransferase-2
MPVPVPAGVPPELGIIGPGARWFQEPIGESGAEVFLVTEPGRPDRYLKTDPRPAERRLAAERDRMTWLKGRLPVPEVVGYAVAAGKEWLVTTAIPGLCACDSNLTMPRRDVVRGMARALRRIHALPPDGAETRGAETRAALAALLARPRPAEDPVFVHGDYCEPNIMFDDGEVSGFIDLGFAGVADRYSDFCCVANTLNRNGDGALLESFFSEYGPPAVDPGKLEYYRTLDAFLG